jgi:hypothetical protein
MSTAPAQGPSRWDAETVKRYIKPHIKDVALELGIHLTGKVRDGWMECHAFDREDSNPSAAINQDNLTYKDLGNGQKAISIFELAIKVGAYKDFPSAVNGLGERFGAPSTPHIDLKLVHPPTQPDKKTSKPKKPGRPAEVVATSDYVDGVRELVYQVLRKSDKSFAQRRPDGEGGWAYNLDGIARVPYHLDELVGAPFEATIWIAEGEKDVDRLRSLGLVATCNSGGAGNWHDEISPSFARRKVVILIDNDEVGRKHGEAVATSLKPHVQEVRILDPAKLARTLRLGRLPQKGDISDLLDMGLTLEQLVDSAATAPNPFKREYATLADAHRLIGDTKWFWPGWIPEGNLSLIAALAGDGKTRLVADICRITYLGLPTMPDGSPNIHPKGTRSLWLMYDRNWSMTYDVLKNYGVPAEAILLPGPKDAPLYLPDWDDQRTFEDLRQQVEDQKPGLIVIDTITYATTKNTAKAEEAKIAFDSVIQVAADTGVPVLGLAHLNKEKGVLNRRLVERARSVIMLSLPDPEGQPNRRKLWVDKTAVLKPPPLGITYGDAGNEYDDNPPNSPEEPAKRRGPEPAKTTKAAQWLWDVLSGEPTKLSVLFDLAITDGIISKPTKEKPNPSKTILYEAKKRIHLIKAGLSIDELVIDGRKWWKLEGLPETDGEQPAEPLNT